MVGVEFVANRIAQRYSNPARTAYTYLFQVAPDSDFSQLIPSADAAIAAWMDEGSGMQQVDPAFAAEHCRATKQSVTDLSQPKKMSSHQRKQMMARSIMFSIVQLSEGVIQVHLFSRSLTFSPKGDREVTEEWHPSGDSWFSAYRPDDDDHQ
jgi:hypothetical protein